ncbi:hypothetical protein FEV16_11580 [Methylocystis sp. B8]|nr:hypothetical protein FEV16_11580 [Methylocystis sp. B8]
MNAENARLSMDSKAVAFFEDAANKLRTYFEREVLAELSDFARPALESELESLATLSGDDPIPPLAEISLLRGEQCAHDLLSMNYEGAATSFIRRSIREAATEVQAAVLAASMNGGNVIAFRARASLMR